ncbi:hypothetical protein TRFO_00909 [Tritrichomonas foetus]|uniref:Guanylate cyclase domain-containing protein n=1 Tax=Tritrichomonas foetus TaxID=1144522 RepID=A0A1J4L6Q9_9EUKA|nr:hypothetical protein TRFO_00909 [Tritrichomonas foetus]|eukprot:OHT17637.1 hypothetical protein TRFO_00909 [Tritrichomonas foetus]
MFHTNLWQKQVFSFKKLSYTNQKQMKQIKSGFRSDDLMYEDDEPKIEELQYQELLDISMFKLAYDRTYKYFSKINSFIGISSVIYYIHIVLSFVQIVSPCLLLNSKTIWDDDSVFSFLLQVVFAFCRGWHTGDDELARRLITLILNILVAISLIILEVLKKRFQYRKVVSSKEANAVISIYKYIIPHLCSLMLCGFPASIRNLANGKHDFINYFNVIITPIVFVLEHFSFMYLAERVLIENHPGCSWNSKWYPMTMLMISINNAFDCAVIAPEKETFRLVLIALLIITYAIFGILYGVFLPHISNNFSYAISASCLAASLTALVSFICIIIDAKLSFLAIIIFAILSIIFYFINSAITRSNIIKYNQIFEDMSSSPDQENLLFNKYFKYKWQFIRCINISFSYWDPYLLSWKPFRIALEKWHDDVEILMLWSKMLAIFPQEASLFQQIVNTYQQNNKFPLTYRLQLRFIAHSRIVTLIPSLRASLVSFEKSSDFVEQMHRRFFENILSKNIAFFWRDVNDISNHVQRLDMAITQLLEAYPNNAEIAEHYCKFLESLKIEPYLLRDWRKKAEILRNGGRLKLDIAYMAALPTFPQLTDVCARTDKFDKTFFKTDDTTEDQPIMVDDDDEELHLQASLVQLMKHSKLGNIIIPSIFIILGTIITIIIFAWFLVTFNSKMINNFVNYVSSMTSIDTAILNSARLCLYAGQAVFLLADTFNRTEIMNEIAPNFYNIFGVVGPWDFSIDDVVSFGSSTRSQIDQLTSYFSLFDITDPEIAVIYNSLFVTPYAEELTKQMYVMRVMHELINLFENEPEQIFRNDTRYIRFRTTMSDIFPDFVTFASVMAEKLTNPVPKVMNTINNIMILNITLVLVLVSIPFIISQFSLGLVSNAIAGSYSTLPNTTIREVISRYSHASDDTCVVNTSSRIVLPSNSEHTYKNIFLYVVPFLSTFIVIFICSFVIYFYAYDMSTYCEYHIETIQYVSIPLAVIYYSTYMLTEVYNVKHAYSTDKPIEYFIEEGERTARWASNLLKDGLWGDTNSLKLIFDNQPPKFNQTFPSTTAFTNLERLIITPYLTGLDLQISFLLKSFQKGDNIERKDLDFIQQSYFAIQWAKDNRDDIYIMSVSETITNIFGKYHSIMLCVFLVVTIVQIATAIFAILALIIKLKSLKRALQFFLFFKPASILQNQQIAMLISEGKVKNEEITNKFKNSDDILLKIPEAIVLVDRDLVIFDSNDSFNRLISEKNTLIGKKLTDVMFHSSKTEYNIDHFEMKLNEVLNGNEEPNFTMNFSFLTSHQKTLYVIANVICLTETGSIRSQSQSDEISSIAIVIDDITSQMQRREKMQNEQAKMKSMLEKVMPLPIVEALQNGANSISFSVQSLSVASVKIETDPFCEEDGVDAQFRFYHQVFQIFDEQMKGFALLNKVRTMLNVYSYAGGLFATQNKPEKHAEEATRFALTLLTIQPQIEEKMKRRVSMTIGLNSGGPVVAGLLSINRPSFQLIGNVLKTSLFLVTSGMPGQVHISRNAYELIYAYNFNVIERGDIELVNGETLRTYFVNV